MFQQTGREYPRKEHNAETRLRVPHINPIDYSGGVERITVKPTLPKNYRHLLDKILEER